MLEAVAAVGLASNVAQFIDFGCNFVSEARSIYETSRSSKGAVRDLTTKTTSLQSSLKSIQSGLKRDLQDHPEDQALAEVSKQCSQTATEIDESLQAIYPPGATRKRDALRSAWLSVWQEERLQSLEARMDSLNGLLAVALLASLRGQAEKSLSQQQAVVEQLTALRKNYSSLEGQFGRLELTTENMSTAFLQAFAFKTDSSNHHAVQDGWHNRIANEIYKQGTAPTERTDHTVLLSEAHHRKLVSRFLHRLDFAEMHDREWRIPKAYEQTFE